MISMLRITDVKFSKPIKYGNENFHAVEKQKL